MQALATQSFLCYRRIATRSYVFTRSTIPRTRSSSSRCLSTCVRISQQPVDIPINPAKRSVYIPTLWNDHSSGLGLIVGLATSGARTALRRYPRSRICPQRPTSFRMAPRHLQHRAGVQVFLTLASTYIPSPFAR
jgi:hypothetical protein